MSLDIAERPLMGSRRDLADHPAVSLNPPGQDRDARKAQAKAPHPATPSRRKPALRTIHTQENAGRRLKRKLNNRSGLAFWTGFAGDAAGARDQFAALLPIRERVLGPEHPDTLTTRHNLARWTGQAGDAAGARDQFAALLPVRERVLGAEHSFTLRTRSQLAYWTEQAGDKG